MAWLALQNQITREEFFFLGCDLILTPSVQIRQFIINGSIFYDQWIIMVKVLRSMNNYG
jgi:hypothetical protein